MSLTVTWKVVPLAEASKYKLTLKLESSSICDSKLYSLFEYEEAP